MSATPTEELGDELYELMLGSDGASADAIQRTSRLMSLRCVGTGSPAVDLPTATADATALRAREVLTEATDDLVKPLEEREPVDDTDLGAAARCFLALERGTEALDLKDRRKEAALYTGDKSIRAMAKAQKRPYRRSHEHKLMIALAGKLVEREWTLLDEVSDRTADDTSRDSPWLAAVHDAWDAATGLSSALEQCCGIFRPEPGEEYPFRCDYDSLELYGKLWKYVKIPGKDDPFVATIGKPEEPVSTLFAEGLTAMLFAFSPFDRETIERLSADVVVAPDIAPIPVVSELIAPWHTWLGSCQCDLVTPDLGSCTVHRFRTTLDMYIKELNKCWDELRDPFRTPFQYRRDHSPDQTVDRYGLRVPPVDRYDGNSV
jgi:hypothetical protein